MSTELLAGLAIAFSALPLLLLAIRDPKRLRSRRQRSQATVLERRCLAMAVALPLVFLLGNAAAALIWLSGVFVTGWFCALWLATPAHSESQ